jgi:hypothetical protein
VLELFEQFARHLDRQAGLARAPGPVSVSTAPSARRRRASTAAVSGSRPMKPVAGRGRFWGRVPRVRSGGKSAGWPGMTI